MTAAITAELDRVAIDAWPAAEVEARGAWLLRATGGYTDRANSVAVLGDLDGADVDRALVAVERFYGDRSLPAKFQLSEIESNRALQEHLTARGYVADKPTLVRTSEISALRNAGPEREVELEADPDDPWFDLWWSVDGRGDDHRLRASALLSRMPESTRFASIVEDDQVLAVALGVVSTHWLGLFCAATHPEARGRQLAGSITSALADWAATSGATHAYCQVAAHNDASLHLTNRAGFTNAHRYRYLTSPTAGR